MSDQEQELDELEPVVQITFSQQEFKDLVTVMTEGMRLIPTEKVPPIAWQMLHIQLAPPAPEGADDDAGDGETGSSENHPILRCL